MIINKNIINNYKKNSIKHNLKNKACQRSCHCDGQAFN